MIPLEDLFSAVEGRRFIMELDAFLRTYEPPIGDAPAADQAVLHTLWGWWMWMSRQALIVAETASPDRAAVLAPLVRSVGEHADLMIWLAETRQTGLEALGQYGEEKRRLLRTSYSKANGQIPEAIPEPPKPDKARRELRDEMRFLEKIEQRSDLLDGGVPYSIYRLLSGLAHAGPRTAATFAPVDAKGVGRILHAPDPTRSQGLMDAQLQDCAVRCFQASVVFRNALGDRATPLTESVAKWQELLRADDTLPRLKKPKSRQVTLAGLRNATQQLLDRELPAAQARLARLADGEQPADLDLPAALAIVKRLGHALNSTKSLST